MLPATPATSRLSDSDTSSDSNDAARTPDRKPGTAGDGGHISGAAASNEPFVNAAECTSLHEGRQQISTILPVNIDTLFHTMYARSRFLDDFHASRKIYDIEHTDWRLDEETNKRRRTFRCKMPIKASIGPKFSCITEIQTLRECSRPGSLYAVDITSWNENVPYGDVFTIYVHHCLVRTVDDHTMFSVYLHVKFRKSVFSVIRSLIERTTYAGVEDFHNDLALQLSRHFCTPPVRHKRHHRNHSRTKPVAAESLGDAAESTKTVTFPTKNNKADKHLPAPSGALPTKTATGIATYSAHELFVQQNLNGSAAQTGNGHLGGAAASAAKSGRSPACLLLALMIAISLLNCGLFVRLHWQQHNAGDGTGRLGGDSLLWRRDLQPQDVANPSSEQWIRMFYGYHHQHQQRLADMRQLLVASIGALRQMEENMSMAMRAMAAHQQSVAGEGQRQADDEGTADDDERPTTCDQEQPEADNSRSCRAAASSSAVLSSASTVDLVEMIR